MPVSLNKKGFTLVEVLCSLGVFSIIFMCMMSYGVVSLNIKKDIKITNNNVVMIEDLKNIIIYSMTFTEVKKLIDDEKFYVSKDNIVLCKNNITLKNAFSKQKPDSNGYMKLTFLSVDLNVYKLNIALYSEKPSNGLELQCVFYKGNYK